MPTEKRHMYETGTINVETGNVAVKQDINYYSANPQSATKSIVRMMEDMDRRFSQNQIYDGLAVSNGGTTVDVASGTVKVGGRWVTIDANNIDATGLTGDYNVIIHVSGVSETNSRDPSGGESVNLKLEASGSWVDNDWKLAVGSANITAGTVNSVQDRAKRQINATIIKPYGSSTQVSIYTGDKPIYREAIRFTSDQILPYNDIVSAFDITAIKISGTSLNILGDISGTILSGSSIKIAGVSELDGDVHVGGILDVDGNVTFGGTLQVSGTSSEVVDLSGSSISAQDFAIGSKVLGQSEFDNLDGLNQLLDTTQKPTFEGIILNKGLQLNGESISGTSVLIDNAELQQLSNIGVNTISEPQWGLLGIMDQDVKSGANVVFGQLNLNTVPAASIDTDKFMVDDSGVIKFRTGVEVFDDIGGNDSYIVEFPLNSNAWALDQFYDFTSPSTFVVKYGANIAVHYTDRSWLVDSDDTYMPTVANEGYFVINGYIPFTLRPGWKAELIKFNMSYVNRVPVGKGEMRSIIIQFALRDNSDDGITTNSIYSSGNLEGSSAGNQIHEVYSGGSAFGYGGNTTASGSSDNVDFSAGLFISTTWIVRSGSIMDSNQAFYKGGYVQIRFSKI